MEELLLSRLFDVTGRVALITGGGRGIGLFLTRALIVNLANVFIVSRDGATNERVTREMNALQRGRCECFVADLSTLDGAETVRAELARAGVERLDVLINNAGASWGEPIDTFPEKGWDKVMALNVKGVFFLTRRLLPLLRASWKASGIPSRVINVGSVVGLHHQKVETWSYDVSKAALHALTIKMAEKLGPEITCNSLAPGFVSTRMSKNLPVSVEAISQQLPMRRTGQAADMAGVVLLLSSPAGSWITGQIIAVDGGLLSMSRL